MKVPRRSLKELNGLFSLLTEEGVDFAVIGNAAISLLLGEGEVAEDVDIVVFTPDPVIDEDFYFDMAYKLGCEVEKNSMGGPRLVFDDGFAIDVFSPSIISEVPEDVLGLVVPYTMPNGLRVKVMSLEAALVLRAQASLWHEEEAKLLSSIRRARDRIDWKEVEKVLSNYEEALRRAIGRALEKARRA